MARITAKTKYLKPKTIRVKREEGESRGDHKRRQNDLQRDEWDRVRKFNSAIDAEKDKVRKAAVDGGKGQSGRKPKGKTKGGRTTQGASSSTHVERRGFLGWNRVDVHTHSRD